MVLHTHRQHRNILMLEKQPAILSCIECTIARIMESPNATQTFPEQPKSHDCKMGKLQLAFASACSWITLNSNTMLDIVCECLSQDGLQPHNRQKSCRVNYVKCKLAGIFNNFIMFYEFHFVCVPVSMLLPISDRCLWSLWFWRWDVVPLWSIHVNLHSRELSDANDTRFILEGAAFGILQQ